MVMVTVIIPLGASERLNSRQQFFRELSGLFEVNAEGFLPRDIVPEELLQTS